MDFDTSADFDFVEDEKQVASPTRKSTQLFRFIAMSVAVGLLAVLVAFITSQCLPFLKPVDIQVSHRMWEVLNFLVITTIIAFVILNSRRKAGGGKKQTPSDMYPIAAIFGELEQSKPDHDTAYSIEQKQGMQAVHLLGTHAKVDSTVELRRDVTAPVAKDDSEAKKLVAIARAGKASTVSDPHSRALREAANTGVVVAGTQRIHRSMLGSDGKAYLELSDQEPIYRVLPGSQESCTIQERNLLAKGDPTVKKSNLSRSSNDGHHSLQTVDARPDTGRASVSQRKLHRRSSSLDDSVQYEPLIDSRATVGTESGSNSTDRPASAEELTPSSGPGAYTSVSSTQGKVQSDTAGIRRRKSSSSCDFGKEYSPDYLYEQPRPSDSSRPSRETGSPQVSMTKKSSPQEIQPRFPQVATREEHPASPTEGSPTELNRKADDFIAKFREQIRMQKLESFNRYKRRLA